MAGFYDSFNDSLINFIRDFVSTWKHGRNLLIFFFKSGIQVQLGGPMINLLFVLSYLVKYVHNDPISYFSYLFLGKEFW